MEGNLSRHVFNELRDRIVDGRLAPGAPISERELGAELDVSRVPIREALRQLEAAGLVTLAHRRTAVVSAVSRTDVDELYDLRAVLEPFIARGAAAAVADGADPAGLTEALALAQRALREADWSAFHCQSSNVHAQIERLADCSLFDVVMNPLRERTNRLNVAAIYAHQHERQTEHIALVEAIAGGRVDLASAVAFSHVEWGRTRALHLLDLVPGYEPEV